MPRRHSKNIINQIRRKVLSGKSKYQVAKEMNLPDQTVYNHTKDIPSKSPGRTEIRGKTLDLLKQLVRDGYVVATRHTSTQFRTLRKHFPMIQRSEMDHNVIYYFDDKNKIALKAMLQQRKSRLINYTDLSNMAHIFNVPLSNQERKLFIGEKQKKHLRKNHTSDQESTGGNDSFIGRFSLAEGLRFYKSIIKIVCRGINRNYSKRMIFLWFYCLFKQNFFFYEFYPIFC